MKLHKEDDFDFDEDKLKCKPLPSNEKNSDF